MDTTKNALKALKNVGRGRHWPILLGLLLIVGLYAGFAAQRYSRLNDLNQRQLANAAAQLKRSFENAVGTVLRFNKNLETVASQGDPHSDGAASDVEDARSVATAKPLCGFDRGQPYLALVPPEACERLPIDDDFDSVQLSDHDALTVKASARRSGATFEFKFLADQSLGELALPKAFGLVFIADAEGRVLYQNAPSKLGWSSVLSWHEQLRDSGANGDGHATVGQVQHVFGDSTPSAWTRVSSMSGRVTLHLAGQDHIVYFEPVVLDSGLRINLVLGGAVPRTALIRQALAVDSYFLTVLVLLLLLTVLGLPFVKLLSIDAHERFSLHDVTRLYLSTAALLLLFTFATEAMNGYVRWRDVSGRGLEKLSARLATAMLGDIREMWKAVDQYDRTVSASDDALGEHAESVRNTRIAELQGRPVLTDWYNRTPRDPSGSWLSPTVPIESVYWIGPTGKQIWKATADKNPTRQNGLSNRLYFRSVQDGNLFEIDGVPGPFYIGPDRSVTNGKFYTFLAMPSRLSPPDEHADEGRVVVGASTQLLSLRAKALPAGYGFAVIDRAGRVLYHSDARLALRENLFDEMSRGHRARAMVYGGHEARLTSAYRERPHEFHLRPLPIRRANSAGHDESVAPGPLAGLSIVTFRETSLEMATVARTFLQSLLGPGLLLIGFIAVSMGAIALVPKARGEHWSVWLWPRGLAHVYKMISAVLAAALSLGLVALASGARDLVLMGLPAVALTSAVAIYAFTPRRTSDAQEPTHAWHSGMFLLFLLCTVVVPASAVFRIALGHEFGKRLATEQAWIVGQCEDAPERIKAEIRSAGRPASMGNQMAQAAARHCGGRDALARAPQPFDALPSSMSQKTHWLLTPYRWADDFLPVSDDALRLLYQAGVTSAPGLSSGPAPWGTRWGLACYAIAIGLLAWWLRRKAVMLFFDDQPCGTPTSAPAHEVWAGCTSEERLVLARAVLDSIVNPYQRPVVERLLRRGVLTLDPNLKPSDDLATFILGQKDALREELRASQVVESSHSWRYARMVLVASGVGLWLFLVATQPGLQSEFIGIASAVSGGLASAMKLWDSFAARLAQTKVPV